MVQVDEVVSRECGGSLPDPELDRLVEALEDVGVWVWDCRRADDGRVRLGFESADDAVAFLRAAAAPPDYRSLREVGGGLYAGGVPFGDTLFVRAGRRPGGWGFSCRPVLRWDEADGRAWEAEDFDLDIAVDLPAGDLPDVLGRLGRAAMTAAGPTECGCCRGEGRVGPAA
jgi:hypothetical protein